MGIFNVSHAFSSAYRFKGVSVGANLKVGYRHTRGGGGATERGKRAPAGRRTTT
nr:UPF0164 family protein [Treponema pallidum]